jgi:hypothetical protein
MKILSIFLLGLLIVTASYSQDCTTLDKASFFKSIKFGDQVPSELAKICSRSRDDYFLDYDSLNKNLQQKYSDIFKFSGLVFSKVLMATNRKGELLFIDLWTDVNIIDSANYKNNTSTDKFNTLSKKLDKKFGKATRIEKDNNPSQNNIMGLTRKFTWECNHILLEVQLTNGSGIKALNILRVHIRDSNFDKIEEIETI